MDPRYLEFFMNLEMSHLLELPGKRKILCVHAGLSPAVPLEELMRMRDYRDFTAYQIKKHIDPGETHLWVREAFFQQSRRSMEGLPGSSRAYPCAETNAFYKLGQGAGFSFY